MFVLQNNMQFMDTLCKDQNAGLFSDSPALNDLGMSDSSRYLYNFYFVKHTSGPIGTASLKFLEITAM